MKCNCCGEEISQVLIRKFFADGSDSNEIHQQEVVLLTFAGKE